MASHLLCACGLASVAGGCFLARPTAMHLRFTDEELSTLLEMISLAAEVASLNRKPGAEASFRVFEDLENTIVEKAKLKGFGDIIEFDEESQKHRVKADHLSKTFVQECIDEMRNEVFWEELTLRLAERDTIRRMGLSAWNKLSEAERRKETQPIEKRYWDEFTKSGIDNLHVVASFGKG